MAKIRRRNRPRAGAVDRALISKARGRMLRLRALLCSHTSAARQRSPPDGEFGGGSC